MIWAKGDSYDFSHMEIDSQKPHTLLYSNNWISSAPNPELMQTASFTGDQSNITSLIIPAPCNFSNDYSANQNNCVKMIPGMMNWFDNNF